MADHKCGDWVKGFLIGGLVGAAIGILYAPKSGKETREELAGKAKDLADKVKEEYETALEKSKTAYEAVVKRLKELETAAAKKAEEVENKAEQ